MGGISHNGTGENNTGTFTNSAGIKKLELNEDLFSSMIRHSTDIITVLDETGSILYESPSAETILGYEEGELIGKNAFDFVHTDDLEKVRQVFSEGLKNPQKPARAEYRFMKKNGSYIYLESVGTNFAENESIGGVVVNSRDITSRREKDEQLNKALAEKEAMLREIHHRVKNNLQIVSSLLSLQASTSGDPKLKSHLLVSQNRVKAMALIHHLLYRTKNLGAIEAEEYLYSLSSQLLASYGESGSRIKVKLYASGVFFAIETAVPFGLLLNELITNSLKHAFPRERTGEIRITISRVDEGLFELIYSDNGIGVAPSAGRTDSFGLNLVDTLVKQLEGTVENIPSQGTKYKIIFRGINYQARFNIT
jgi:PAS domain S-box-containing protein